MGCRWVAGGFKGGDLGCSRQQQIPGNDIRGAVDKGVRLCDFATSHVAAHGTLAEVELTARRLIKSCRLDLPVAHLTVTVMPCVNSR